MTIGPSEQDGELERQAHLHDDELSAYINGEIAESRSIERLRAHLDACPECRERLAETWTVVALLHRAETPAPLRSFKLDPHMVGPRPVPVEPWFVRLQPAMRRLTAVAAALLLVIVVADALSHTGSGGSQSKARDVTTALESTSGGAAVQSSSNGTSSTAEAAAMSAATAAADSGGAAVAPSESHAPTAVPGSASQQPMAVDEASARSGTSYWRLAEFAVVVVVVWLLFLTVAFPRLQQRRKSR